MENSSIHYIPWQNVPDCSWLANFPQNCTCVSKQLWQCVKIPIVSVALTSADLTNSQLFSRVLLCLGGNVGRKNIFCSVRDLGRFRFRARVKGRFNSSFFSRNLGESFKTFSCLDCSEIWMCQPRGFSAHLWQSTPTFG